MPSGVLSRNNHDPRYEHTVALQSVFRYLNGMKDWQLRFRGALTGAIGGALGETTLGGEGEGTLRCYADSDYAGCPHDYKSTS
jgi:hypothetical protein